ncbi:MAG: ATP-binding protein [Pyrinomonadaceae bacterium]|nr:ATP-binding protein [Pyrinomonadaceae bacterium]
MLVLLHLFALLLLVLLGFYVFVANPRSRAHQTFAAFIAFLALWTTKDLVFWNFQQEGFDHGWWAAASFIISLLMQFALVVFAWVFPENSRTPRRKAAVLFAPALVFIPSALFGFLWKYIDFSNGSFTIALTPIAYAFVGYVYFLFFYGAAILFRKYRLYRGSQQGQQTGAILWGLIITGILKTIANIALPFFGQFELLSYSSIFVLPGVLIYAYAISNFKLFSLQSALDQFRLFPLTYKIAISIAVVAIVSFTIFQVPIAWWSFRDGMTTDAWRKYLVFSVISALVPNLLLLLLVVRTISRPVQRITLAAIDVIKGSYGTEVDLRKSNDEIGILADSFNQMSRKMASDIEQLRNMNEQLMRTDRLAAMGTLAAGVAHEINNPLASISSLIQMIRTQQATNGEQREQLDLIASQIQRISRVTKDLTDFARVRPAARTAVEVSDVISSALRLAQFDATFQELKVEVEIEPELPNILADADQLQQVFLNLVLNARDAMPGGGEIRINAVQSGSSVRIGVSDSGSGLDELSVRKAFDPFYTTKPAGKGTGLGLAVCYGIITAHNGTIDVENNPGGGAMFTVTIPALTEK